MPFFGLFEALLTCVEARMLEVPVNVQRCRLCRFRPLPCTILDFVHDQASILGGVVDLPLHDTRKPLLDEHVSRPHEKPTDP